MKMRKLIAALLTLMLCCSMVAGSLADAYDIPIDEYQGLKQEAVDQLVDQMLATESTVAFTEMIDGYNEEQLSTIAAMLSEEQIAALQAHIDEMAAAEYVAPETVVFTHAGPFMPPVNVAPVRKMLKAPSKGLLGDPFVPVVAEGLVTSKKVTTNSNDTYTVTLESYTTGTVTIETSTVPVDIVLVLDQSGSMNDSFGRTTRQEAMKTAVTNFIDAVANKYSEKADHRISIVTYSGSANQRKGWTNVDDAGKAELKTSINELRDPSGATRVDYGMQEAANLMNTPNYQGNNTERQKVVIVFTDGVPTTSSDFSTTVANNALDFAKKLKDKGVTVYSVGIFTGANKDKLYGDGVKSTCIWVRDSNCDGTVGSTWGRAFTTLLGTWILGDVYDWDVDAGNRFLNYLSNNFMSANEIGLRSNNTDFPSYHTRGWRISKNFDRDSDNYYLTASDSESLNAIFHTISQQIETKDIDLGSETVVKDVVTPYFDLPANTSDIKVYTADYNGSTFGTRTLSSLVPSVSGNTVTVSGFDYNANYVSSTAHNGSYGKKLIVEFTVTPKAGFLGGNQVPTNVDAQSGIFSDNEVIENFEPDYGEGNTGVDVTIPTFSITAQDKNVYVCGSLTEDQLKDGLKITIGDSEQLYSVWKKNLDWQDDYVELKMTGINDLMCITDDTTYTATLTIAPNNDEGTVTAKEKTDDYNIYVFKPELTFTDDTVDYGTTLNAGYFNAHDYLSDETVWKHGDMTSTGVTMIGKEPDLTLTYNPAYPTTPAAGGDIPIVVTVKIGEEDAGATFAWIADDKCTCTARPEKAQFRIHCRPGYTTLTITKSGLEDNDTALFTVTGDGLSMSFIMGNGSHDVTGLIVGKTYTVTEDMSWAWRYTTTSSSTQSKTLSATATDNTLTFVNKKSNDNWLGEEGSALNEWSTDTTTVTKTTADNK